jgi:hypothetical protein
MICKWLSFMLLLFVYSAYPQKQQPMPDLNYAELIKNKDAYLGKTVRLTAVWRYGFEWTYLCTSECKDVDQTWVDVLDEDDLCPGSKGNLKKMGIRFDNTAQVVVKGKLQEGSRYGHMGAYRFQFVISCIEKFKRLR